VQRAHEDPDAGDARVPRRAPPSLDRSGALIALGGGVCMDIATVAASSIRRLASAASAFRRRSSARSMPGSARKAP
jgi:hypothetical protein